MSSSETWRETILRTLNEEGGQVHVDALHEAAYNDEERGGDAGVEDMTEALESLERDGLVVDVGGTVGLVVA